ncbi:MAG: glycoside hydrolase family 9 protein, partial [Verrucomicrobiales bacterium]
VAALAEIASSPTFKTQFPAESAAYLAKARAGWNFLMTAIAIHGKNGSYQKITHYGNEFMHDDELAWAAAALFAATGEAEFHAKLKEWYDPSSPETRRWSWWRLFEGYGCAARAYAFAARSGRLAASTLDAAYLAKCAAEIKASGDDIARFAKQTAYGTSFPDPNKSFRTAGWYFSMERAFEAATAYQLNPDPQYMEAIHSNLAYEAGCNPVNVSYITGLGWKRWRDIVHQYAQNDHRVLPPSGIPLGNIQGGFAYLENYKQELGKLAYPPDGAVNATYPYYDRFGDSFNTTTEFVVVDQARALATTAFLLAQTGDYNSPSKSMIGSITGLPVSVPAETEVTATLQLAGINLSQARIVWEAADQEPFIGPAFKFAAKNPGSQWVEVEAQLPDGRRIYARTNFMASFSEVSAANSFQSAPLAVTPGVVALYHLDGNLLDVTGKNLPVTLSGQAQLDDLNLGWMSNRSGKALRFFDLGDKATVNIPGASLYTNGQIAEISLEAMIFINSYKAYNRAPARILSMQKTWNATLELMEDIYTGPHAKGGTQFDFFNSPLAAALPIKKWSRISLRINNSKYSLYIDGHLAASSPSTELAGWAYGVANLEVGNFDGWMDEITIRVSKPGSSTALNILPNIHFVSPQPGTTHQANDSMELEVATDDPDGTISKVEYFLESEKLCEQTLAPFRFIWTNVPAGQYSVQAVATDNSGGKSAPAFVSMTAVTPPIPPSPSHLFVKTLSRSSIQISWRDNSTNETGFRIYRSLDGSSFNEIVTLNANVILWKDYTVKPDTTYYYAVMAFNKAGESSEVVGSSVTFPYPPAAPVLTALTSTSSGIQVKWNPAATATSYKVKRSPTAAGPYTAVATSVSNTTFIDADVEPGVAYYYMVNAINIGGESPNSATGIVLAYVANSAQAAAPSLLFVKALSRSSIQVSWKDNSYNEDGFRIYRSLDGINFQEKAVVAPNVVIWKDYTVIPNTTYYYAVVAINEVGESAEIAGSATTLPFPPSIPANLTGIFQQGGINLAWSPVANALTYQVKRSSAVNGPWTTIATGVKSTSFKDTALTGGTTYYYSVSAVNTGGESANSLQVAITPPLAVVAFQEINTVLGGSWIGSKGSQGNIVISRTSTVPPYAAVTASGNSEWIWDYSTVDERALEVPLESTRIAACWFSQTSFDVMVNIQNSDEPKLISFYCLDWDNSRRSQTIQVIDPGLNTVLHTYQLSDFSNGVYVNYRLKGQVIFRLTRNAGPNAVLSGIYFDN